MTKAPPPPHIKAAHKALQHQSPAAVPVLDIADLPASAASLSIEDLTSAFRRFSPSSPPPPRNVTVHSPPSVPGLLLLPSLLPPAVQTSLLDSLLTTHLSSTTTNTTNLHAHYHIPPSLPWFSSPPSTTLTPRDPTLHPPLPLPRALSRKLRWLTLGGQYDWTLKRYPTTPAPQFPPDIADLVRGICPAITPQAAIANFYSPADTLAPHRDVAEESRAPLVSVSVGCEAVLMVEAADDAVVAVRLRGGDVCVMGEGSRWRWHSVPRVVAGTCALEVAAWGDGWLAGKRVNLNVRQMWD